MSARKSSEDRKAEILAVTLDLAFEVGPDHVTTGLIAGKLGLTQPAIYKHFPKKEDIWRAATETLCAKIRENTRSAVQESGTATDNLRRLVLGHLQLVAEAPALPEIMVARDPAGTLAEARRAIEAEMKAFRMAVTRSLEMARSSGHLHGGLNPEDGVMLLFGIIQSLALRLIVTRNTATLLQDGERLLDLQLMLFTDKGHTV